MICVHESRAGGEEGRNTAMAGEAGRLGGLQQPLEGAGARAMLPALGTLPAGRLGLILRVGLEGHPGTKLFTPLLPWVAWCAGSEPPSLYPVCPEGGEGRG